ncbi:MAG: hypothetical protein A2Y10_17640 [Planctomycetes bacterium GWF2_41_51]|nr:MAG: hypothetical protein A2Y10_17640 [Planctomycetes bacterium GWF2_41_51]HBG28050.1 hypothetical protein [Phycisphaerales bacterium]
MKNLTLILIICIAFMASLTLAVSTQEILVGTWDMTGTASSQSIKVPINDPILSFVTETRNVLADSDGDIVFGTFIEGGGSASASVSGGQLVFSGAQIAYIKNALNGAISLEVEFDFTTSNISQEATIMAGAGSWDLRIEPDGANARLKLTTWMHEGGNSLPRYTFSNWAVSTGVTHHVKFSIINDNVQIVLDGVDGSGPTALQGGFLASVNPHLHMGAKWNGGERYFTGTMDDITVKKYESFAGDWPMLSSTKTTKNVDVPVVLNQPETVTETRTVMQDPNGDVVFGQWLAEKGSWYYSPEKDDLLTDALEFEWGNASEMAYIPNIFSNRTSFRCEFDVMLTSDWFEPSQTILVVPQSWIVRTERGAAGTAYEGKTRLLFITYFYNYANGTLSNHQPSSPWIIEEDQWHHVTVWTYKNRAHISIDGYKIDVLGGNLDTGLHAALYPHLFIGANWNANGMFFDGNIKNIKLTAFDDYCGESTWGYLSTDFNLDCRVDFKDFAALAESWLQCTDPEGAECINLN